MSEWPVLRLYVMSLPETHMAVLFDGLLARIIMHSHRLSVFFDATYTCFYRVMFYKTGAMSQKPHRALSGHRLPALAYRQRGLMVHLLEDKTPPYQGQAAHSLAITAGIIRFARLFMTSSHLTTLRHRFRKQTPARGDRILGSVSVA